MISNLETNGSRDTAFISMQERVRGIISDPQFVHGVGGSVAEGLDRIVGSAFAANVGTELLDQLVLPDNERTANNVGVVMGLEGDFTLGDRQEYIVDAGDYSLSPPPEVWAIATRGEYVRHRGLIRQRLRMGLLSVPRDGGVHYHSGTSDPVHEGYFMSRQVIALGPGQDGEEASYVVAQQPVVATHEFDHAYFLRELARDHPEFFGQMSRPERATVIERHGHTTGYVALRVGGTANELDLPKLPLTKNGIQQLEHLLDHNIPEDDNPFLWKVLFAMATSAKLGGQGLSTTPQEVYMYQQAKLLGGRC